MKIRPALDSIASIPKKIKEYAEPRPETSGDSFKSSPLSGAMSGGIQGYIAGGPVTGAAGVIGGYVGVKAGEKAESFTKALGAGTLTGAGIAMAAVAGLTATLGGALTVPVLAASGILGGLSGATGTLAGSRRASTRDGSYGGFLTGMTATAITGNSALFLAGTTAGGIGGKAVKAPGRAVLGALSGTALGAVTGVLGGPFTIAAGAAAGAVAGGVGAVIGPPIRQIMRNGIEDISNKAVEKLEPFLAKNPLGKKSKITIGALAGAVSLAPLGIIFGLPVMAGAAAIGAAVGAVSTYRNLKNKENAEAQKENSPVSKLSDLANIPLDQNPAENWHDSIVNSIPMQGLGG